MYINILIDLLNDCQDGRAIAQAVSRRLPTATARVRARIKSCAICGGQSGIEVGFFRVLRFPLPIRIPPIAPQPSIIQGWYNRPISGRCTKWTQSRPMRRKKLTVTFTCVGPATIDRRANKQMQHV
jgi:hypothetical protein